MENPMSSNDWHGMTIEQVLAMFEDGDWAARARQVLVDVMMDKRARGEDRLVASNTLNVSLAAGLFPPDDGFPLMMREVLLDVAERGEAVWFAKRAQRRAHAKLVGVQWLVRTVEQIESQRDVEAAHKKVAIPDRKTPALDDLLS
jgi:hypothetical protein